MRRFHLEAAAAMSEATKKTKFDERAMDFWVTNFGSAAAGWLVWQHRDRLHRYGAVDFKIDKKTDTPPWFRIAVETLKRRSKRWEVTMVGNALSHVRTYRVRWLQWQDRKPLVLA